MFSKSFLLASAAALVASSSAYAADAVVETAPVAANYVKVCDTFGAGFFYIPGSDVCLKISGRIRVTAQSSRANFNGAYNTQMKTDGRVEIKLDQATDFGLSEAAFRLSASGGNLNVDETYIGVGDFFAGYNIQDTKLFDQEGFGVNSFYVNANAEGDAAGNSYINGDGNMIVNGTGIRVKHDFGSGFSAALEAANGGGSSWTLSNSTAATDSQRPVVRGQVAYSAGAIKNITLAAAVDTAQKYDGRGFGVTLSGLYAITDALSLRAGAGYSQNSIDHLGNVTNDKVSYATGLIGAQYQFTNKIKGWTDVGYISRNKGLSDTTYANLGVQYNFTSSLYTQLEEVYEHNPIYQGNFGAKSNWTTLLRLRRDF